MDARHKAGHNEIMTDSNPKHRGRKFRPKRLATSLPRPTTEAAQPAKSTERIAKVMARAGLASRREAEAWIAAGRVAVNGQTIVSPALNVTAKDRIVVDGKPLPQRERTRLFLFHKPRGLVTTSADTHGRPTIFGVLPKGLPRLISVGRLDMNTEGLLLLTNDGGLARALELPATGWLRRYRVRAFGQVTQPQLDKLRDGITVDGIHYGAIEAKLDRVQGSNVWITFAMREGKNREIRNVLRALGLQVNRLIRVSFGPFQLGELPDGAIEEVKTRTLRDQLGPRLAAQAGADFSAALVERADATPSDSGRSQVEARQVSNDDGPKGRVRGKSWRGR
jgi:23S rRNA pseudouridine2605 synthase